MCVCVCARSRVYRFSRAGGVRCGLRREFPRGNAPEISRRASEINPFGRPRRVNGSDYNNYTLVHAAPGPF